LNDIFKLSEVKSNKIIDSNNVTERTLTESNICNFSKENQSLQTIINTTEETQSILIRKENFLDKEDESSDQNLSQKIENSELSYNSYERVLNLAQLTLYSNNWILKCALLNKTEVKNFVQAKTFREGKFARILLQDNCSNTIEIVAFNDYVQKFEELKMNHVYLIENCIIKESFPNNRGWPKTNMSVDFELNVTKNTIFTLTNCKPLYVVEDPIEKALETDNNSENGTKNEPLHSVYPTIDKLIHYSPKTKISTIGVIFSIENIETIYKKIDFKKNSVWDQESRPLKKINFKLIDYTQTYINVAIWNEQEEQEFFEMISKKAILFW
jgi:hypothetical protein